jgi:hypothetical protein
MSEILQPKLLIYKDETTYMDVSSYLRNINVSAGDVDGILDTGIDNSQQKLTFTLNNSIEKNFNPNVFYGAYSYAKALLKGNGTNKINYPFNNIFSNTIGCITYGENRTVNYDNYTLATFTNFDLQNIENYELENGSINIEIITYDGSISHNGDKFIFDEVIATDKWLEVTFAYYDTTKLNEINDLNGTLSPLAQANAYIEYYETYGDLLLYREEITITSATEYTLTNSLIKGSATPYFSTNTNVDNKTLFDCLFKTGSADNKIIVTNSNLQIGDVIGIQYAYINGSTEIQFKGKLGNKITSTRSGLTCIATAQDKPLRVFYTPEDTIRDYSSAVTLDILVKEIMEDTSLTLESTDIIGGKTVYTFNKEVKLVIEDPPLFNVLPKEDNLSGKSAWNIIQDYMAQSTYFLGVEYSSIINDIALVMRFPPRSTTETPVLECTSSDIVKSTQILTSDENVRDKVVVKYVDENNTTQTVTKTDPNSTLETTQTAYIDLPNTSAIDTQEEAETLAQTVLEDLSTVTGQVSLELNYTPTRIRFFDTVRFYDRLISDQPLNLYVESINKSIDFSGKSLTITLTGSTIIPRTHNRRWTKIANAGNKFQNNVKAKNFISDGILIGTGVTDDGNNGLYSVTPKDDALDTIFKIDTDTGQVLFQSEDGEYEFITGDNYLKINSTDGVEIKANNLLIDSQTAEIKNDKFRIYAEPTGSSSQVLINVDYTNTTLYPGGVTAQWQVGDTDGNYLKYENGVQTQRGVYILENTSEIGDPTSYIDFNTGYILYGYNNDGLAMLKRNYPGFFGRGFLFENTASDTATTSVSEFRVYSATGTTLATSQQTFLEISSHIDSLGGYSEISCSAVTSGTNYGYVQIKKLRLDTTAPTIPIIGNIWYNQSTEGIRYQNGSNVRELIGTII